MKSLSITISGFLLLLGNQALSQSTTQTSEIIPVHLPENMDVEFRSTSNLQILQGKEFILNQHYKISTEEKLLRREEEREIMIKNNPIL